MWIFNLETRKSSSIAKRGDWSPSAGRTVLEVQDNTLYVLNCWSNTAYSLSLFSLLLLIQDEAVQAAFYEKMFDPPLSQLAVCRESFGVISAIQTLLEASVSKGESLASDLRAERSVREQAQSDLQKARQDLQTAEASLEPKDQEIAALRSSLREAEEARDNALSLAAQREAELQAAGEEIAGLRADNQRLRAGLERVTPPPGTILVHLPRRELPTPLIPQRWRVDAQELQDLAKSMSSHQDRLPRQSKFVGEYRRTFGPLLEESLPRRILSASSSAASQRACDQSVAQAAGSMTPGRLFLCTPGLAALGRRLPLRPGDKLLDSAAASAARTISSPQTVFRGQLVRATPPVLQPLISQINRTDPLRVDALHRSTARLRDALRASKLARSTLRALQRLERFGATGRAGRPDEELELPWGAARRGPPGPPLVWRSAEPGGEQG